MYRFLFIVVAVVVVALAVGYGLRSSHKTSALVTGLLPRETVAFIHVPDLERTRDDWHRSDIYQLYREPAVQEFLRRPLSQVPNVSSISQTARDIEQLDPKDAFLAVTAAEKDNQRVVAGFRFHGTPEEADRIVAGWRQKLLGAQISNTPAETIDYQKHQIQVYRVPSVALAMVYTDHWFLASNSVDELKAVVDRADGRVTDKQTLLSAEPNFREAMGNMPASYAICLYLQPKVLAQQLNALRSSAGGIANQPNQSAMIEQMRSICATTRFDGSKMHDLFFVGMPQQTADAELTRNSIALASTDTFIYVASLLNISKQFALVDPSPTASFLGARLQKIGRALASAGVTADQWNAVFGSEIGAIADWKTDVHWPATLVAFPVKDFAKARKIGSVLAYALDDDGAWVETDKNGVHYISTPYMAGIIALRPTIAISERFMVLGLDTVSVEAAIEHAAAGSVNLSSAPAYKRAVQALPEPRNMFTYLDLGLLYTRLDAALRPMLLMSAAFMPAINEYVDVSKLPAAEVITRHLSPIVSSQRYHNNGYIAESIGPITVSQTGIGALIIAGAGAFGYQHSGLKAPGGGLALPSLGSPNSVPPPPFSPGTSPPQGFKLPTPVPSGTP
jgi:hypothetical protein